MTPMCIYNSGFSCELSYSYVYLKLVVSQLFHIQFFETVFLIALFSSARLCSISSPLIQPSTLCQIPKSGSLPLFFFAFTSHSSTFPSLPEYLLNLCTSVICLYSLLFQVKPPAFLTGPLLLLTGLLFQPLPPNTSLFLSQSRVL